VSCPELREHAQAQCKFEEVLRGARDSEQPTDHEARRPTRIVRRWQEALGKHTVDRQAVQRGSSEAFELKAAPVPNAHKKVVLVAFPPLLRAVAEVEHGETAESLGTVVGLAAACFSSSAVS
jgi:hypothetical protein